jgi:hypothetical protein
MVIGVGWNGGLVDDGFKDTGCLYRSQHSEVFCGSAIFVDGFPGEPAHWGGAAEDGFSVDGGTGDGTCAVPAIWGASFWIVFERNSLLTCK